jgi:hypothetical protein
MATYELNGQKYDFPEGISDDEALRIMQEDQGQASEQMAGGFAPSQPIADSIDPSTLASNKDWLAASKILFEYNEGRKWGEQLPDRKMGGGRGGAVNVSDPYAGFTDDQLAQYGLDTMGWFNYNLIQMGVDAGKVQYAPDDFKQSFLYLMDSYDNLEMSLGGTWRLIKGASLDPTTYVGLGTFGIGTAGAQGGKVATKEGLKELLKAGVKASITTGIEGMAYGAATSVATQSVEVSAGAKDAISGTEVMTDSLTTGVAALGLGTAVHAGGSAIGKAFGRGADQAATDATRAADSAIPPADPAIVPSPTPVTPGIDPAALTPNPGVNSAAPNPNIGEPSLPGNLAGAKPRYNYGQKGFGLAFESDVEKALFITSQAKKSARDDAYRDWLKSVGFTDKEIDTHGQMVRDHIKSLAKGSNDPELTISKLAPRKEAVQSAPVDPAVRTPQSRPEMTHVDSKVPTNAQEVVAAVKAAAPDMSVGNISTKRTDLFKSAESIFNAFRNMGVKDAQEALDLFTKFSLTQDQQTIIKVAVQQAAEHATVARSEFLKVKNAISSTADEVRQAQAALEKIGPVQMLLSDLDKAMSSPSGRDLGSRVGGMLTNERRGMSVESILKEDKIDIDTASVEELTAAENELIRRVDDFIEKVRSDREIVELEKAVQQAHASGDMTKAATLLAERDALMTVKAQKEAAKAGAGSKIYDALNKGVIAKLNEYIISTVFTPATLVVNALPAMVKTVIEPSTRFLARGMGKAARAEASHTYGAMMAHSGAAFRAARLAFKYEQGLLTGKFDRVLEHAPAIKGMKGRVLRTFPRLLNATDEFFSQIHYRGFVAGDAAHQASERGMAQGLKGNALKAFVKAEVEKTVNQAYEMAPNSIDVIDMLRIKGTERGLKGDALGFWIKTEMDKNHDLFKRATREDGKNYANDVLFKREFSKSNAPSKIAGHYEHFVNSNPIMRLVGQLFFRTPVRVFQEGIRLTPGYQFMDPTFITDLIGKGGTQKMIRAKGQLLISYGITAGVVGMYSTGMITGSGPNDYKQRRMLEDTGWQPYSIRRADGSWWSYRNMDPFATPIKIMVNLMDRMSELEYRRSQGEKTDGLTAHLQQYLGVVSGSMVQAIRDASLTTGFDQLMTAWDALTQEDDTTMMEQLSKLGGKKAQLLVPALWSKSMNMADPTIRDPLTLEQFVMTKLDAELGKVPAMYDALGRPRTVPNSYTSFLFPLPTSKEMMDDGATEREHVVLQGLSDLAIANSASFAFPYKMPGFDFDMRKRMTADGKETVYDRVIRRYRELDPSEGLYPLFADGGQGGMGTKSSDGSRMTAARQIINAYRKAAFAQVLAEEMNLQQEFIQNKLDAAEAQAGMRDSPLIPFR